MLVFTMRRRANAIGESAEIRACIVSIVGSRAGYARHGIDDALACRDVNSTFDNCDGLLDSMAGARALRSSRGSTGR